MAKLKKQLADVVGTPVAGQPIYKWNTPPLIKVHPAIFFNTSQLST